MAKWLVKANDLVLSHCTCPSAIAAAPAQLDCPWCGCGWMIPCEACGKSFTFAQVMEVDRTYEDLASRWFAVRKIEADAADIAGAARWMEDAVYDLPFGAIVVHVDCWYLVADARDLAFTGEFASHNFERLPHAVALENPAILRNVLGDPRYWLDRERPDRNVDDGA